MALQQTDEQRENLLALAEYLDTGITEYAFDMRSYFQPDPDCGTVACALGHAPYVLGHSVNITGTSVRVGSGRLNWEMYSYSVFGIRHGSDEWDWCFHGFWVRSDNTPRGAAARIYYMLEHGVPNDFADQRDGLAPHSYTVQPLPTIEPCQAKVNASAA